MPDLGWDSTSNGPGRPVGERMIAYLGGAPYPIFELLLLHIVLFFATAIYFGLNYEVTDVEARLDREEAEEVRGS